MGERQLQQWAEQLERERDAARAEKLASEEMGWKKGRSPHWADEVVAAIERAFAEVREEARAAAIEECAAVLDDELRLRPVVWGADHGQTTPLHRLAREIRALANKGTE